MKKIIFALSFIAFFGALSAQTLSEPIVRDDVVFEERDCMVAVEAEFFYKQSKTEIRQWYRTSKDENPAAGLDPDLPHVKGASNNAYMEILPDTRANHSEKLIDGENFSNTPGVLAIMHYKVWFNTPGKYYVWVRAHSTGSEDNGVHVGMDGKWPETGQRLQWCDGKKTWRWESKQRTDSVHCGEPYLIYLEIREPGLRDIQFSLREDGFEFDKFVMTTDREYCPEGEGPDVKLKSGFVPGPFPDVKEDPTLDVKPDESVEKKAALIPEPKLKFTNPKKRMPDGDGTVKISGEMKQWHKVTLTLDGPFAHELDKMPNAFTDYNMMVNFTHESGSPSYDVPGYFAADGNAAETGADAGTKWRAHVSPDKTGKWIYKVTLKKGKNAAQEFSGKTMEKYTSVEGEFEIGPSDKSGRDFRSKGRLEYVGGHHLQFKGSKEYFLKAGADAPETLLAYMDIDATYALKPDVPVKSYKRHIRDWKEGYPTWKDGQGKGLIGAVAYLSGKGANSMSFLTYNAGGDGENVWPFISRNEKFHYDCSKLDQWGIIFDFAQSKGIYLHFKMQENESDDNVIGKDKKEIVKESLDGGDLGPERKLYCRELIARYGYLLALNWNIGEENTQSPEQQREMIAYIDRVQPYNHNIVIHSFPEHQEKVYEPLLGDQSLLTGASLQNDWNQAFKRTLQWRKASAAAGRPWVVANDEQGSASEGVPPDPGYMGYDASNLSYDLHDIRKQTLYANLMAGGAGVEYYFGYKLPENDLVCEDFRSRDKTWDYCRIALEFFNEYIPFQEMENANERIGNRDGNMDKHCLAKEGEVYLVYLAYDHSAKLDLGSVKGRFKVWWFNPREGGELQTSDVTKVKGGKIVDIGTPPGDETEDWLVLVKK